MTGPVVALRGFSYAYPAWSDDQPPVLRDVDLALHPGLTVVGGDSGAGKSTLLRVLNGLVPHFHGGRVTGRAEVHGMDVLVTPTRQLARRVGFVFQEPDAGFVRGTVAREVAFGPENLGLPPATVRRQVGDALERVGISGLAGRRIRTLSGGERQRVALAAALAAAPDVLAMDEPLSQLDEQGAAALVSAVAEIAADGRTVVAAEHRAAMFVAGARALRVDGGIVVEDVSPPLGAMHDLTRTAPAPCSGGPAAWALHDVTVGVGGRDLLCDVDAAGGAGEIVLVTGANGTGKTTLLRTIAGLHPAPAGHVERRPGRVAYLPQDPGILLHRQSVRAEIEQTLHWTGAAGGAAPILDLFGLAALADHDPRDLSVGQRQRAALAAVLAGDPALALLDEPTRGMDAAARRGLADALTRLAEQGASVVLATHDVELAHELPGRLLRIDGGALRPEEIPCPG